MSSKLYAEIQEKIDVLPIPYSAKQILRFVAGRTLRYDKLVEAIPKRHFMEGVADTKPCGVPESTLKRGIKILYDEGYITVNTRKGQFGSLPNQFAIDCRVIKETANSMESKLKIPKRRAVSPCFQRGSKMNPPGVQNEPPEEEITKEDSRTKVLHSRSAGSARELVELAKQKNAMAVARKADRLSQTRSADHLRAAWTKACSVYYPGHPVPPVPAAMAGRFRQQTIKMLPTGQDLADFIEWAVRCWPGIRSHFRWMNKPPVPSYPDLEWCSRHCTRLLVAQPQIREVVAEDIRKGQEAQLRKELHEARAQLQNTKQGPAHFRSIAASAADKATRRSRPKQTIEVDLSDIPDLPPWRGTSERKHRKPNRGPTR